MSLDYYVCASCGKVMVNDVYEECSSCGRSWCSDECASKDNHLLCYCNKYEECGEDDLCQCNEENECNIECEDCEYYEIESCAYCRGENFDDDILLENALYLLGISREKLCDIVKKSHGDKEKIGGLYGNKYR